jgi:hypothetical protein
LRLRQPRRCDMCRLVVGGAAPFAVAISNHAVTNFKSCGTRILSFPSQTFRTNSRPDLIRCCRTMSTAAPAAGGADRKKQETETKIVGSRLRTAAGISGSMRAGRVSAEARSARPRRTRPHHNGGAVLLHCRVARWPSLFRFVLVPGLALSNGCRHPFPTRPFCGRHLAGCCAISGSYAQ